MLFPLILIYYLIKCCNITSETSICHFSWIFRDGFPLAQREKQMYEEQKQEEEAKNSKNKTLIIGQPSIKKGWRRGGETSLCD